MSEIRVSLLSDGSSDRALIPILTWTLSVQRVTRPVTVEWADLRNLYKPPNTLGGRIKAALDLYPCDILLIHRDAETISVAERTHEIINAGVAADVPSFVSIIAMTPRRMMEAWLLIDSDAIRKAAANPSGGVDIPVPNINDIESIVDPKELLFQCLKTASELKGRRMQKLHVRALVHRVSELIADYTPLRQLPAFQSFERELSNVLDQIGRD